VSEGEGTTGTIMRENRCAAVGLQKATSSNSGGGLVGEKDSCDKESRLRLHRQEGGGSGIEGWWTLKGKEKAK